jgi:N-sulfoglucosamine sulfohydrolase
MHSFPRLAVALLLSLASLRADPPLNILFFTADDMNYDSAAVCGGPIKDLTPNIDKLAGEGLRFEYAYSTVAVCQPVREIMQTGLYPHRNGAMGFFPIKSEVRTLNEQLHAAGYLISMFGKGSHNQPAEKFCVDLGTDKISRHPSQLAEATRKFLKMAREQNRPFFHNVNCYDPHRPFIGINGPGDLAEGEPPSRWIKPEEITGVPGFLEDLPDIRRELAGYYTNVRRLDDALGAVLAVLKEEGFAENTLVMFYGGDHGMSFPFAKSNDYENSSRGNLIIRWPGVTKPGMVDTDHLVSTLDFTPSLLDAAKLPAIPGIDGRSFIPAVKGDQMTGWDRVFTFYNAAFGNHWLPMRCMRTKERSYIWNAWSDGKKEYHAENMAGLSWKTMLAAAPTHPEVKARADFYLHRVPEEFYDMSNDRNERINLINAPSRQTEIEAMRKELLALMKRTGDPLAEAFSHRDNQEMIAQVIEQLKKEYGGKRVPTTKSASDPPSEQ